MTEDSMGASRGPLSLDFLSGQLLGAHLLVVFGHHHGQSSCIGMVVFGRRYIGRIGVAGQQGTGQREGYLGHGSAPPIKSVMRSRIIFDPTPDSGQAGKGRNTLIWSVLGSFTPRKSL